MNHKTRKRFWPVSLATAIGVVVMLTVLAATVWGPTPAQAQQPVNAPSNLTATVVSDTQIDLAWNGSLGASSYELQRKSGTGAFATIASPTMTSHMDTGLTASTTYTYQVRGVNSSGNTDWSSEAMDTTMAGTDDMMPATGDETVSSSSTGSAAPEIKLIIKSLDMDRAVGSSIVLYLEDDFVEPSSIPATSVYIVAEGTPSNLGSGNAAVASRQTGNGSRVYVTSPAKVKTDAYFDLDKSDIAIRVLVPDMCTNATDECEGPNGLRMGQTVTVVFESDSGIKNPSEQKDDSSGDERWL